MKRRFFVALNDRKLIVKTFEEEKREWDFTTKSPKYIYGLGFEYGANWAYRWLKNNGYLKEPEND